VLHGLLLSPYPLDHLPAPARGVNGTAFLPASMLRDSLF
jgi:hypothetical protein